LVLKRLIDVRWSAHADAVSALDSGYNEIQSALNLIANDEEEEPKTIIEAKSLSSKMDKLENVILTSIWNRILSRFNMVSKEGGRKFIRYSVAYEFLENFCSIGERRLR
jgi:hypothetical protein